MTHPDYSAKYENDAGSTLSVARNSYTYGNKDGLFEILYVKHPTRHGDVDGYLTAEQVEEIIKNYQKL